MTVAEYPAAPGGVDESQVARRLCVQVIQHVLGRANCPPFPASGRGDVDPADFRYLLDRQVGKEALGVDHAAQSTPPQLRIIYLMSHRMNVGAD